MRDAQHRGEDEENRRQRVNKRDRPTLPKATSSSSSVVMKKQAINNSQLAQVATPIASAEDEDDDDDENHDPSKENDPSLSPSPVIPPAPLSPRKSALGKRPLSDLPTPTEPDEVAGMSASERNISANLTSHSPPRNDSDTELPLRKSPKLTEMNSRGVNASGRIRDNTSSNESKSFIVTEDEKENLDKGGSESPLMSRATSSENITKTESIASKPAPTRPSIRKTSTQSSASSSKSNKARIGIRRL